MRTPAAIVLLAALLTPLHSQTILEWALSETSPTPDVDITSSLNGTLQVPIIGDGVTSSITNSSALMGRFTPVTLANPNDSITISYELLAMGGASGGGTNADVRWGLFNSNGTAFGGNEANLSGWTGTFAFNAGSAALNDADLYVRNIGNTERFYTAGGATDLTGPTDYANQNFNANGVIYTITMTVTRLADGVMDISTTLTGDNGYALTLTGQETTNAEFTFDRVGFWVNDLGAELVVLKATSAPASTDGDSIPDLEEARWFNNLFTADDTTDFDSDGFSDLHEITVSLTDPTDPADPAVTSYATWAADNAGGQDPNQDFDLDGIENGVEFFMGSVAGFTANPSLDATNTITWPKSGSFVGTYKVQTSPDLIDWTDETATDNGSSVSFTLTGVGKRFVRLVVTPN